MSNYFWQYGSGAAGGGGSGGGDSDGGGSLSTNPLGWLGTDLGRKSTRPISGYTGFNMNFYYSILCNTAEGGGTGQGPALGLDNTNTNVRLSTMSFNWDGSMRSQMSFGPKSTSSSVCIGYQANTAYSGKTSAMASMFNKDDNKIYIGCITQNNDDTIASHSVFGIEVSTTNNLHILGQQVGDTGWSTLVGMETADDKSQICFMTYSGSGNSGFDADTQMLFRWGPETTGNPDNLRMFGGYTYNGTCVFRRGVADDNTTEPWYYVKYSSMYVTDGGTPNQSYPGGSDTDSSWQNMYKLFSGSSVGKDAFLHHDAGSDAPICVSWLDPDNSNKVSIGIIGKVTTGSQSKKAIFWKQRQVGGVDETKLGNWRFTADFKIWYVDKSTTPHSAVNLILSKDLDSVISAHRWAHKTKNATLPGNTVNNYVWLTDTDYLQISNNKYPGTQPKWTVTVLDHTDFTLTAPSTTRPPVNVPSDEIPTFTELKKITGDDLNRDIGAFGNNPEWNWGSQTLEFPSSGTIGENRYFVGYNDGDWSPPEGLVTRGNISAYYAYCPIDKDTILVADQINPTNYQSSGTGDANRTGLVLCKIDMSADLTDGPKIVDACQILTTNTDQSSIYNRTWNGKPYGWSTGTDSHYFAFQTWNGTFTSSNNPLPNFGTHIMKFKDDMTLAWQKYYNGFSTLGRSNDSNPRVNAFDSTKDSNILITAEAGPKSVNTRNYCWWLMLCLDKDGTQQWKRAFAKGSSWGGNSGSNNNWSAGGGQPAFDADKNVYIPWYIANPYSGEMQTECGIMKVNKDGTQQWSQRYWNISLDPQNAPNGFINKMGIGGTSCVHWNNKVWFVSYIGGPGSGPLQLLEIDPSDGTIDKIRNIQVSPSCSLPYSMNYPNGYLGYLFVDRNGKLIMNVAVTGEGIVFIRFDTDMTVKNVWSLAGGSGMAAGPSTQGNLRDMDGFCYPYQSASKMSLTPTGRTGFVKFNEKEGGFKLNQDLFEILPNSSVTVSDYSGSEYSATTSHSCTFFTPSDSDYGPMNYDLGVTAIDVPSAGWPNKGYISY